MQLVLQGMQMTRRFGEMPEFFLLKDPFGLSSILNTGRSGKTNAIMIEARMHTSHRSKCC